MNALVYNNIHWFSSKCIAYVYMNNHGISEWIIWC